MQLEVKDVLKIWAKTQLLVTDNTTLLMKYNHDNLITELCVARMKVHNVAEEMLMNLEGRELLLPQLLINFFEANKDKGCSSCWASSVGSKHEDCDMKIKRWFDTREKLLDYLTFE